MMCNNPQRSNHTPVMEQKTSCWILSIAFYRTALAIIIGLIISPALVYGTGHAQQNESEIARESLNIEQRHSQEIQELKDRLTFLEEQQSSILDEIAQRVTLGGYGALEFENFEGSNTSFEGKLEVLISGQIHDRIRFYNEIDLGIPDGTAEAEQAYVDFLLSKWFNLRGGVILVPFGKWNLDHFDPMRDLTDRPLVAQEIVPTTWGDLGVSAFGFIPWTSKVISTYEIAVINGLTDDFSPTDGGLQDAKSDLGRDNNGDKAVVGRATVKFVDQYEIGLSGYCGASDYSNNTTITGYDVDFEFKPRGIPFWEDFEFKGEFAAFHINDTSKPSRLYGYYLQTNYHFWPSFFNKSVLGQPFNHPTFTLVGRYDHAKISTTAGTGDLTEDRFTVGLNYRPIEEYVIKTEYQINNGGIGRKSWNGFLASIAWLF